MGTASPQRANLDPEALPIPDWHDPLAGAFRRWGHLQAKVDPLERAAPYEHPDLLELEPAADPERAARLRRIYCGALAADFMHLSDRNRASWLVQRLENEDEASTVDVERVAHRAMDAEIFERFLHKRYVGAKRYSLEGTAGLIPMLDAMLDTACEREAHVAILGMSHRGRLTVMVDVVGVEPAALFAGLEDVDPRSTLGAGDVKYHLGATGDHVHANGEDKMRVHLVSNPSHLEAVNPVVMGRARARQTRLLHTGQAHEPVEAQRRVLPICLHGDAAFAGQGVTAETLNMADLPGYTVGGTVHVVVNNRIGFTAEPTALHSSRWSSDLAKRMEIPILRVNGEDPRALVRAGRIAVEYRQRFGDDVLVELVGYRRYGHSEVEDPTTTSPRLYASIEDRPMLWELLAQREGLDRESLDERASQIMDRFSNAQDEGRSREKRPVLRQMPSWWDDYVGGQYSPDRELDTRVSAETLDRIAASLTQPPVGFSVHPKVERFLAQRAEMLRGEKPLDYGAAEAAAFGSLLLEGRRVRLSGQDSRRGTFNHRNSSAIDTESGQAWVPLAHLDADQAELEIVDSPLSEAAVLGFEYGFSRDWPDGLVAWEAQFGDFANGAQIHIDQFLAAGEDKWQLLSGLVVLLPHGYEGQGPEHSSARMERFLQLASEHNMQICQPSTAAQYFHLLRRQVIRRWRKPLIVFTPKGMLRAKSSTCEREELTDGRFHRVLADPAVEQADRILVCSGKILHELREERDRREDWRTAVVGIEQLYPFPEEELHAELARLKSARKIVWVQEEPANMGALAHMRPELQRLGGGRHVTTVKRSASASPATGSAKAHRLEQEALIRLAFA